MTEAAATVKPGRKLPAIWLVPFIAAALGIWMVVYNLMTQGPEITITFPTAEGIEAGKTKIKALNVELGVVGSVELSDDLEQVKVTAQLQRFAIPMLSEDTQFWVVRPRIGPGGISGLGTILSGGYIQLEAGTGKAGRRKFAGLESPPVTPAGAPGLKIFLESGQAGSVSPGDPVLYRGFRVGKIEEFMFDAEKRQVRYTVFIDEAYEVLINSNTRFWNASGFYINASATGVEVDVGSLQSILTGGITFDTPNGLKKGRPVENGALFKLYPNKESTRKQIYRNHYQAVVAFKQNVSGLVPGAPVEYRGIQIGTVERLMLTEALASRESKESRGAAIPVLIRIDPARLGLPDTKEVLDEFKEQIFSGVPNGLRATLQTGNLLTGQLLINFDYFPDAPPAELGEFYGYPLVPTLPGGLERIQQQINALLTKLNALPVEPAVDELNAVLVELRETVDSFSPDSENGDQLNQSLSELNRTLRSIEELTRQLSDKPNSIIFSPPIEEDPVPEKRQ